MPKIGDRVIVEGNKVGHQRREGTLLESVGTLIKVRWADGTESLFTPGAGSVRFESGNGKGAKAPAKAAPAKGSAKSGGSKAAGSAKGKAAAKGKAKKPPTLKARH